MFWLGSHCIGIDWALVFCDKRELIVFAPLLLFAFLLYFLFLFPSFVKLFLSGTELLVSFALAIISPHDVGSKGS